LASWASSEFIVLLTIVVWRFVVCINVAHSRFTNDLYA